MFILFNILEMRAVFNLVFHLVNGTKVLFYIWRVGILSDNQQMSSLPKQLYLIAITASNPFS